jgi:glyoxylase-like metal-dependent hydrolase (beta-lactamase superfamily II)
MKIADGIHLISGGFTNIFIIEDGGEVILVDAYWDNPNTDMLQEISKIVDPKNIKTIILSHGHTDHIGAASYLEERTTATFAAHLGDAWLVENPTYFFDTLYYYSNPTQQRFAGLVNWMGGKGVKVGRILRGGDIVQVGSKTLEIIHLPGHSNGSIGVYDRGEGALFTGDTPTPSEWYKDFLGIVFDARNYVNSLQKMIRVDPSVLGQAHGSPRRGEEAKIELEKHVEHCRLLERTILEVIGKEPKGLLEIKSGVVEQLLDRDEMYEEQNPINTGAEWFTVHTFLQKLCFDGKLTMDKNLKWRKN